MAKLNGGQKNFRVLFDGEETPNIGLKKPDISNSHEYLPLYVPQSKNEWFYVIIDSDQHEEMIDDYLESRNFGTQKIEQMEYTAIKTIFELDENQILFTRVTGSMKSGEAEKSVISFTDNGPQVDKLDFSIELSGEVDAYYDGKDRIYFKSFSKAKSFFKGFEVFYQEASREEKEIFLASDLFSVTDLEPDFISPREAKLMSEIVETIDLGDLKVQAAVRRYAKDYPLSGVSIDSAGKLKIHNKDHLGSVLKLLSQKYFTTGITDEQFEANSTKKLGSKKQD